MNRTQYTLTDTTLVISGKPITFPVTIAFNSDTVGRKIELSFDGTEFFDMVAELDKSSATQLVMSVLATFASIKVTGDIADTVVITQGRQGIAG